MTAEQQTCVHEAGHCTVASQFGFGVRVAVVHRPGEHPRDRGRVGLKDFDLEKTLDPFRVLVYQLAGGAAVRRATGRPTTADWLDREMAAKLAATMVEQPETHPAVTKLLGQAEAVANALMDDPHTWAAVQRVAAVLKTRRVLSGRDIQLLREARQ